MAKTTAAITGNTEVSKETETTPKGWEEHRAEMEDRMTNIESRFEETASKLDKNNSLLEKMIRMLAEKEEEQSPASEKKNISQIDEPGILAAKPDKPFRVNNMHLGEHSSGTENLKQEKDNFVSQMGSSGNFIPRPKIELPFFEGQNPRGWIKKCQKYFSIFAIPEHQKIEIASMYLNGKAETWFDGYIMQKYRLTWQEFTADLCHRFCDKTFSDVVEEFNKIVQKGSVEEYQERFEELQPLMLQQNSQLSEGYFVSSFISGLKEELKHKVKVLEPKSVFDAARQAKLYELAMEIETKKQKYVSKNITYSNQSSLQKVYTPPQNQPQRPIAPNQNNKTALVEYRRTHNLCFRCGERFSPGHQCKVKQLNSMEEGEDQAEEEPQEEGNTETECQVEGDNLEISMNALTGNTGYSTLRIQGIVKGKPLNILIDSGSTHSFIIPRWAKEGLEVVQTNPLTITVANGEKLYSTAMSKLLSWKMQGYNFEHDFRVLQMGGSDMVLGVDWMKNYSPIVMDFKEMTLSFQHEGKAIILQGGQRIQKIKLISEDKLQKFTQKNQEWIGEIFLMNAESSEATVPEVLQPLLEEYKEVFEDPKGMPPPRQQDHAIVLKSEAQPVNLRPYRFPHHQKAEVERQIKEMLSASIIQTSQSPFASPCLLVKKKDGTWRLCVDYRQLNSMTVKNKFPIPVVEDLLDELTGARYFSKIDLRSGYWQIRIKKEDVHKTAFRTHQGHFEFKVMPFGLTNAPATFQSLMNQVFEPFLRKFVLVFFDDILVYSCSLQEHIAHLRTVLTVLRENQLFAKKTKCFFGQEQVEYLGYIISAQGVSTDQSKVAAMMSWPFPKNLKSLRGFLGLTGYYRKFIKGFGDISRPLTQMLKKGNFELGAKLGLDRKGIEDRMGRIGISGEALIKEEKGNGVALTKGPNGQQVNRLKMWDCAGKPKSEEELAKQE
ncbi:hypothetical protein GQ457_03G002250 [Hibiscus cannabinus]